MTELVEENTQEDEQDEKHAPDGLGKSADRMMNKSDKREKKNECRVDLDINPRDPRDVK